MCSNGDQYGGDDSRDVHGFDYDNDILVIQSIQALINLDAKHVGTDTFTATVYHWYVEVISISMCPEFDRIV